MTSGSRAFNLNDQESGDEISTQDYVNRAITTQQSDWSNRKIMHCYNPLLSR
jgi:hypothetical protein